MAHTHEYDCIVCGGHYDSMDELSKHNLRDHMQTASGMERPRDAGSKPVVQGDEPREPAG